MSKSCAVVTGGARNIGQAIALRLQQDGYRVFVLDIESPEAESLQADAHQVDLSDINATRRILQSIADAHAVTCLVNNVGIVRPALLDDTRVEDFDPLMHLNVRSALVCTQSLLPSMRRHGQGRIVMNASRVVLGSSRRGSRLPRPLTPPGIRFRTTAVHEERLSPLDRIEYRDQALLLEPFPWQGLIHVRGTGIPPGTSPIPR